MTVTYESPRVNKVGSLHAMTLTHEDGPLDADVGGIPALPDNPISAT